MVVWRWDDKAKQLVKGLPGRPSVTPSQAEEYYGLHFARQALDIDPAYARAQQVLLSLVLEKAAEGPAARTSRCRPTCASCWPRSTPTS